MPDDQTHNPKSAPQPDVKSAARDTVAASSEPDTSFVGGVEEMVREIRTRLTEISSRELELRRREQEFERQYRRLQENARKSVRATLEQEVQQEHADLAREREQLRDRLAEVVRRQAELDAREQRVRQLARDLDTERAKLADHAEQLHNRIVHQRARQQRHRQALRKRIRLVRERERDLTQRITAARNKITTQRAEIERLEAEIQTRNDVLREHESKLQQRQADLDARQQTGAARAAEIEQERTALAAERQRITQERRELDVATKELRDERERVRTRQREYEKRWQETHGQQHQLARDVEHVDARRRVTEQRLSELEEREQRLEQREEQFHQRLAELEIEREQLSTLRNSLEERQQHLANVEAQIENIEKRAQELQEEAIAVRERAESREAEARQAALQVELDRNSLCDQEAQLQRRVAELDRQASELESHQTAQQENALAERQHLADLRQRLERNMQVIRKLNARGPIAIRFLLLALAAGLLAAITYWLTSPVHYRAATDLHLLNAGLDSAARIADHRHNLLDPLLLKGVPDMRRLASQWEQACRDGRVVAVVATEPGDFGFAEGRRDPMPASGPDDTACLRLTLQMPDADAARRLLQTACDVYMTRPSSVTQTVGVPPEHAALAGWQEELDAQRTAAVARRSDIAAELADLPGPEVLSVSQKRADEHSQRLQQIAAELEDARARLSTTLASTPVAGVVDPVNITEALAEDTIHAEDRSEYRSVALRYRSEVAVSMLQVLDPARILRQRARKQLATIDEQMAIEPPEDVAAVLESGRTTLTALVERINTFLEDWQPRVEAIRNLSIEDDIVAIVEAHNEAANVARRLTDVGIEAVDQVGRQIESLDTQNAGTRAVVVAAVLRGDHAALKSAVEELIGAAGGLLLERNVDLDALDHQLRGLRTRLKQRRAHITQQLQDQANRDARAEHQRAIDTARAAVRELETQRESLINQLVDTMADQERIATRLHEQRRLAAQRDALDDRIAWLDNHLPTLEATLDATRQQTSPAPPLERGPIVVQALNERSPQDAAALGGIVAAGVGLLGMMLLLFGTGRGSVA